MNLALDGLLLGIAIVATGVSIAAGNHFGVAVPAATLAVLAAGLLIADEALGRARPARRPSSVASREEVAMLRAWFRSGRLGRESITDELDQLERSGPNPQLPRRSAQEMSRIAQMPYSDFRNYVRQRLDDLESRS